MYSEIGKKIKGLATLMCIIGILFSFVLGVSAICL